MADEDYKSKKQVTLDHDYNEETAAEVVPLRQGDTSFEGRYEHDAKRGGQDEDVGKGIGFFALSLSIISLIFLPIIFGGAGIIFGFIARRRGVTTLGSWSIGLGALSILLTLFVSPFT